MDSQRGATSRAVEFSNNMKLLLMICAVLEAPVGFLFLLLPGVATSILLGVPLETPAGLVAGRLAGAAILALGIVCWHSRETPKSVTPALLCYNLAAAAILVYAGIRLEMSSALLWPVMVIHFGLAVWCVLCLWAMYRTAAKANKSAVDE